MEEISPPILPKLFCIDIVRGKCIKQDLTAWERWGSCTYVCTAGNTEQACIESLHKHGYHQQLHPASLSGSARWRSTSEGINTYIKYIYIHTQKVQPYSTCAQTPNLPNYVPSSGAVGLGFCLSLCAWLLWACDRLTSPRRWHCKEGEQRRCWELKVLPALWGSYHPFQEVKVSPLLS